MDIDIGRHRGAHAGVCELSPELFAHERIFVAIIDRLPAFACGGQRTDTGLAVDELVGPGIRAAPEIAEPQRLLADPEVLVKPLATPGRRCDEACSVVLTSAGQSTEAPIALPSRSSARASDNATTAYLVMA